MPVLKKKGYQAGRYIIGTALQLYSECWMGHYDNVLNVLNLNSMICLSLYMRKMLSLNGL